MTIIKNLNNFFIPDVSNIIYNFLVPSEEYYRRKYREIIYSINVSDRFLYYVHKHQNLHERIRLKHLLIHFEKFMDTMRGSGLTEDEFSDVFDDVHDIFSPSFGEDGFDEWDVIN